MDSLSFTGYVWLKSAQNCCINAERMPQSFKRILWSTISNATMRSSNASRAIWPVSSTLVHWYHREILLVRLSLCNSVICRQTDDRNKFASDRYDVTCLWATCCWILDGNGMFEIGDNLPANYGSLQAFNEWLENSCLRHGGKVFGCYRCIKDISDEWRQHIAALLDEPRRSRFKHTMFARGCCNMYSDVINTNSFKWCQLEIL